MASAPEDAPSTGAGDRDRRTTRPAVDGEPAPAPVAGGPTLRRVLGGLLAVVLALAILLFVVTVLQLRTADERNDAERQRLSSFRLAGQVRQSSNDLTRMVRLYVTTGDARYRVYYDTILDIRRGTVPRPVGYDSSFWDRVIADGYASARTGPPVALTELMRRARFSQREFRALENALQVSDRLAGLEIEVMDEVARRVGRGRGDDYLADVGPAYQRLVDGRYHREKRRIMAAIESFIDTVDRRTADRASSLQDRTSGLLVAQTAVLALLGLVLVLLLTYATRTVVRPLERLTDVTRRIRGGDWDARAPREGVREIRQLAGDFDEMTDAVQRELLGRRRMEQEAVEARRRLQTIADRVPGAVFQFHVDRHAALSVRFASRDTSVHGVVDDGGVDARVARAVIAGDRGDWLDSLVAAATGGDTWEREYRIRTPDGGVAWMHGHALVRRSDDGSADLYGYINDITVQKALEAELLRAREAAEGADRAKSAFLAMMSHELRTPLVAVTGTLEVLALDELEGRQRERIDVAARSARTLLAVIGEVLDFSKIEAGHLELLPVPSSLPRLAHDLVAQNAHRAERAGLSLDVQVQGGLAPAHVVDGERLRQVLGNLVGNAIKFTATGGVRIVVGPAGEPGVARTGEADRAERGAAAGIGGADGIGVTVGAGGAPAGGDSAGGRVQRVELLVEDTGIGVSDEDQARLFAPFTQASTDSARRSDGTGLGLVISRQLVEAMGGRLTMESVVGIGTTMRVLVDLPTADEPRVPAAEGASRDVRAVPRRARPSREGAIAEGSLVLLVEDHPVNRTVLAAQIEAAGVVVDVAGDAAEALERFGGVAYGFVFTDIQLPGVDGYELAARMRALEAAEERPRATIMALTASAVAGEAERCRAAGMDDLVTKPTTIAVLAAALRRGLPQVAWPEPGGGGEAPAGPDGGPGGGGRAGGGRGGGGRGGGGPGGGRAGGDGAGGGGGEGGGGGAGRGGGEGPVAGAPSGGAGPRSDGTGSDHGPVAVDRTALDELTGGDPELGRQVLAAYVVSLGEDVRALRDAAARDDATGAGHVAHRMGSAGRMVGATAVAAAAERLEADLRDGEAPAPALVDAVAVAADAVVAAAPSRE